MAIMNTFSEYAAAMIGCYAALPQHEREELHAWELQRVDGSGVYCTSDWLGWEKYIGIFQPREQKLRTHSVTFI
ncbi:MAG: hypothetical protein ACTHOH_02375 [Lysobacteraceae bacterium]